MTVNMTGRQELLAPAGNMEKLEVAIHYGADAVYLGGQQFSLRQYAGNFSLADMEQALKIARRQGVKVYVACNIFPRTEELSEIRQYLRQLQQLNPDALIIADPGVVDLAQETAPELPIHLSTQANVTNLAAVRFWERRGIKRINIAREVSLAEIQAITSQTQVEIEAFVHGAMCMAYSGRCLLSGFMSGRESNRGLCCQPCRFQYALVEEKRPGQFIPITEDEHGTYIFNSKDLCMINHLPAMSAAGIYALKIEGRMKGINYLATVVKTYREALDALYHEGSGYHVRPYWQKALDNLSHRGYCTGFYLGADTEIMQNTTLAALTEQQAFIGRIIDIIGNGIYLAEIRANLLTGNTVEIMGKSGPPTTDTVRRITDQAGTSLEKAKPNTIVKVTLSGEYQHEDLIKSCPRA